MTTPLAAVALPVAAAGAMAVNAISSAAEGFSKLFQQKGESVTETKSADSLQSQLEAPLRQLQEQIARRLREAGSPLPGKVEVRLDEFGLLKAFTGGQERPEISRWLSEDFDLVRRFSEVQTTAANAGLGSTLSVEVDLGSSTSAARPVV